jgi:hypothetical protein
MLLWGRPEILHRIGKGSESMTTRPTVVQNIQIASLSFQSSELGPPTHSPARECYSSPLEVQGERETHSLSGEGVGATKGQTLWYPMYTIILLCCYCYTPSQDACNC